MRLQVNAATISVLSGTWAASADTSKNAVNAILKSKFARDVEAAYKLDPMGQRQKMQKKRSLETKKKRNNKSKSNATKKMDVDVGILATGSNAAIYPQFLYGQKRMGREETQRFLQDEESKRECPSGCPQEFCDCGWTFKEVQYCTKEMISVCERGLVSRCVRTEDIEFYEETYCPYAACVENNESEEVCHCDYYSNYCRLFYEYDDAFDSCITAECCEKTPAGEKATCVPALQPTFTPTATPTASMAPTVAPSVRFYVCFGSISYDVFLVFNSAHQRLILLLAYTFTRELPHQQYPVDHRSQVSPHHLLRSAAAQPRLQSQLH